MTEQEAIRAFGENCKWLRRRIQELEEQLGIRQGMAENPVQWGAFLAGLEAGYALGAAQKKQEED